MCFSGRKVGLALSQIAQELRRVLHRLLDQFGYGLVLLAQLDQPVSNYLFQRLGETGFISQPSAP